MVHMSGHLRSTRWKRRKGVNRLLAGWRVGAPTLDVWVVRKDFAEKHPEVVKAFAKALSMPSSLISLILMNG